MNGKAIQISVRARGAAFVRDSATMTPTRLSVRRRTFRPVLEFLEGRSLPSAAVWGSYAHDPQQYNHTDDLMFDQAAGDIGFRFGSTPFVYPPLVAVVRFDWDHELRERALRLFRGEQFSIPNSV